MHHAALPFVVPGVSAAGLLAANFSRAVLVSWGAWRKSLQMRS
jgi:hypothetical protein